MSACSRAARAMAAQMAAPLPSMSPTVGLSCAIAILSISAPFLKLVALEHLAQVGEESLVLAQGLAGRIGQLGHRLAIAGHQLHDDVERGDADIVRQVGADAETGHAAVGKVAVQ